MESRSSSCRHAEHDTRHVAQAEHKIQSASVSDELPLSLQKACSSVLMVLHVFYMLLVHHMPNCAGAGSALTCSHVALRATSA